MKVIGIASSPRRHGNSETLLDQALAGASSRGAKSEKIVLSCFDIRPCYGSGACLRKAKCFVKDDMLKIIDKIKNADGIIVSSPVYFGSITAQLKAMIDRCQPLWVEKYKLKNKASMQKQGAFICVSSYSNKKFFRNSSEILNIFFKVIDANCLEQIYFPGLENKQDVQSNPAFLKTAFRCGKHLLE